MNRQNSFRFVSGAAMAALALMLAGCGGGDNAKKGEHAEASAADFQVLARHLDGDWSGEQAFLAARAYVVASPVVGSSRQDGVTSASRPGVCTPGAAALSARSAATSCGTLKAMAT